jgi:hypothetical protein
MLQGELEHRSPKARYKRTSKKNFVKQLTQLERREARIRLIRQRVAQGSSTIADEEHVPTDPMTHHHIGVAENHKQPFSMFLQSNNGDPAITVRLLHAYCWMY